MAALNDDNDRYVTASTESICLSTASDAHHYSFLTLSHDSDVKFILQYDTNVRLCEFPSCHVQTHLNPTDSHMSLLLFDPYQAAL